MPFPLIPLAISGISALAGALGNRKSTSEQTQNIDETSTPTYTPEQQQWLQGIMAQLFNRYNSGTDLSGYEALGLKKINQGADLQRKALQNIFASRGLSYSPAAGASLGRIESGRIGEAVNFSNSIPLLQRQLQGEDLNNLAGFFSRLPVGQKTTGTRTGTATQPGNVLGGLVSGLGTGLASTFGYDWALQQQKKNRPKSGGYDWDQNDS